MANKGQDIDSDMFSCRGPKMGWLKWAFVLSFFFLLRSLKEKPKGFFKQVLRQTIKCGGDTDTNAAIVGGMIGAAVGYKLIED